MFQSTVKIEVTGGPIIYIDPTNIATTPADADFVLLTHNHGDHQSVADLNRVRKASTCSSSSRRACPDDHLPTSTVQVVTPGPSSRWAASRSRRCRCTISSFNNHPRVMNFVGYVVNVGGVRVYQAGDTERIPR